MAKVIYLQDSTSEYLDGLMDAFNTHLQARDRGRTSRVYVGDAKRFADWVAGKYGSFKPAAVTALDLVEYRAHLQADKGRKRKGQQDRPKAPGTVNRILVSIRVFFDWLKEIGQVRDNPVDGVKSVAVAMTPAPKWLTRAQQAALLHAVQDGGSLRDMALVQIMLHAGLRISEVCALAREDIEISERKGIVRIRQGKANKYREVPINKTARKVLVGWLDRNPSGPLFPNRYGRPISQRGVFALVAGYAYRAKLAVTPHTLRHCFFKNLIDLGVPIDQVAMLFRENNVLNWQRC